MKKFISMFVFATAMVFTAVALVSCSKDDNLNQTEALHRYSMALEAKSSTASSAEAIKEFNSKVASDYAQYTFLRAISCTQLQASMEWMNIINDTKTNKEVQEIADELGKKLDDSHVVVTLKMIQDGTSVVKTKDYSTHYPWLYN